MAHLEELNNGIWGFCAREMDVLCVFFFIDEIFFPHWLLFIDEALMMLKEQKWEISKKVIYDMNKVK